MYDDVSIRDISSSLPRYIIDYHLGGGCIDVPTKSEFFGVVFFVDISGYTALTEKYSLQGAAGVETLSSCLNGYFGEMLQVIREHGGDTIRFAGDALIVLFTPTLFPKLSVSEINALSPQISHDLLESASAYLHNLQTISNHHLKDVPLLSLNSASLSHPFPSANSAELTQQVLTVQRAVQCALDMRNRCGIFVPLHDPTVELTIKIGVAASRLAMMRVGDPQLQVEVVMFGPCMKELGPLMEGAQAGDIRVTSFVLAHLNECDASLVKLPSNNYSNDNIINKSASNNNVTRPILNSPSLHNVPSSAKIVVSPLPPLENSILMNTSNKDDNLQFPFSKVQEDVVTFLTLPHKSDSNIFIADQKLVSTHDNALNTYTIPHAASEQHHDVLIDTNKFLSHPVSSALKWKVKSKINNVNNHLAKSFNLSLFYDLKSNSSNLVPQAYPPLIIPNSRAPSLRQELLQYVKIPLRSPGADLKSQAVFNDNINRKSSALMPQVAISSVIPPEYRNAICLFLSASEIKSIDKTTNMSKNSIIFSTSNQEDSSSADEDGDLDDTKSSSAHNTSPTVRKSSSASPKLLTHDKAVDVVEFFDAEEEGSPSNHPPKRDCSQWTERRTVPANSPLHSQRKRSEESVNFLVGDFTSAVVDEYMHMFQFIFVTCQRIIQHYRGYVHQFLYDDKGLSIICAWGVSHAAHARMDLVACSAAVQIKNALCAWRGPSGQVLRLEGGLTGGTVFSGTVGDWQRREFSIVGSAMNRASRIMSKAGLLATALKGGSGGTGNASAKKLASTFHGESLMHQQEEKGVKWKTKLDDKIYAKSILSESESFLEKRQRQSSTGNNSSCGSSDLMEDDASTLKGYGMLLLDNDLCKRIKLSCRREGLIDVFKLMTVGHVLMKGLNKPVELFEVDAGSSATSLWYFGRRGTRKGLAIKMHSNSDNSSSDSSVEYSDSASYDDGIVNSMKDFQMTDELRGYFSRKGGVTIPLRKKNRKTSISKLIQQSNAAYNFNNVRINNFTSNKHLIVKDTKICSSFHPNKVFGKINTHGGDKTIFSNTATSEEICLQSEFKNNQSLSIKKDNSMVVNTLNLYNNDYSVHSNLSSMHTGNAAKDPEQSAINASNILDSVRTTFSNINTSFLKNILPFQSDEQNDHNIHDNIYQTVDIETKNYKDFESTADEPDTTKFHFKFKHSPLISQNIQLKMKPPLALGTPRKYLKEEHKQYHRLQQTPQEYPSLNSPSAHSKILKLNKRNNKIKNQTAHKNLSSPPPPPKSLLKTFLNHRSLPQQAATRQWYGGRFLGRIHELDSILNVTSQAQNLIRSSGNCKSIIVCVGAESGVGKSRLVSEVVDKWEGSVLSVRAEAGMSIVGGEGDRFWIILRQKIINLGKSIWGNFNWEVYENENQLFSEYDDKTEDHYEDDDTLWNENTDTIFSELDNYTDDRNNIYSKQKASNYFSGLRKSPNQKHHQHVYKKQLSLNTNTISESHNLNKANYMSTSTHPTHFVNPQVMKLKNTSPLHSFAYEILLFQRRIKILTKLYPEILKSDNVKHGLLIVIDQSHELPESTWECLLRMIIPSLHHRCYQNHHDNHTIHQQQQHTNKLMNTLHNNNNQRFAASPPFPLSSSSSPPFNLHNKNHNYSSIQHSNFDTFSSHALQEPCPGNLVAFGLPNLVFLTSVRTSAEVANDGANYFSSPIIQLSESCSFSPRNINSSMPSSQPGLSGMTTRVDSSNNNNLLSFNAMLPNTFSFGAFQSILSDTYSRLKELSSPLNCSYELHTKTDFNSPRRCSTHSANSPPNSRLILSKTSSTSSFKVRNSPMNMHATLNMMDTPHMHMPPLPQATSTAPPILKISLPHDKDQGYVSLTPHQQTSGDAAAPIAHHKDTLFNSASSVVLPSQLLFVRMSLLTPDESISMACEVLGVDRVGPHLAETLVRLSNGLPLFIFEFLMHLRTVEGALEYRECLSSQQGEVTGGVASMAERLLSNIGGVLSHKRHVTSASNNLIGSSNEGATHQKMRLSSPVSNSSGKRKEPIAVESPLSNFKKTHHSISFAPSSPTELINTGANANSVNPLSNKLKLTIGTDWTSSRYNDIDVSTTKSVPSTSFEVELSERFATLAAASNVGNGNSSLIPMSLTGLLLRKLDALTPHQRATLKVAAVAFGNEFTFRDLMAIRSANSHAAAILDQQDPTVCLPFRSPTFLPVSAQSGLQQPMSPQALMSFAAGHLAEFDVHANQVRMRKHLLDVLQKLESSGGVSFMHSTSSQGVTGGDSNRESKLLIPASGDSSPPISPQSAVSTILNVMSITVLDGVLADLSSSPSSGTDGIEEVLDEVQIEESSPPSSLTEDANDKASVTSIQAPLSAVRILRTSEETNDAEIPNLSDSQTHFAEFEQNVDGPVQSLAFVTLGIDYLSPQQLLEGLLAACKEGVLEICEAPPAHPLYPPPLPANGPIGVASLCELWTTPNPPEGVWLDVGVTRLQKKVDALVRRGGSLAFRFRQHLLADEIRNIMLPTQRLSLHSSTAFAMHREIKLPDSFNIDECKIGILHDFISLDTLHDTVSARIFHLGCETVFSGEFANNPQQALLARIALCCGVARSSRSQSPPAHAPEDLNNEFRNICNSSCNVSRVTQQRLFESASRLVQARMMSLLNFTLQLTPASIRMMSHAAKQFVSLLCSMNDTDAFTMLACEFPVTPSSYFPQTWVRTEAFLVIEILWGLLMKRYVEVVEALTMLQKGIARMHDVHATAVSLMQHKPSLDPNGDAQRKDRCWAIVEECVVAIEMLRNVRQVFFLSRTLPVHIPSVYLLRTVSNAPPLTTRASPHMKAFGDIISSTALFAANSPRQARWVRTVNSIRRHPYLSRFSKFLNLDQGPWSLMFSKASGRSVSYLKRKRRDMGFLEVRRAASQLERSLAEGKIHLVLSALNTSSEYVENLMTTETNLNESPASASSKSDETSHALAVLQHVSLRNAASKLEAVRAWTMSLVGDVASSDQAHADAMSLGLNYPPALLFVLSMRYLSLFSRPQTKTEELFATVRSLIICLTASQLISMPPSIQVSSSLSRLLLLFTSIQPLPSPPPNFLHITFSPSPIFTPANHRVSTASPVSPHLSALVDTVRSPAAFDRTVSFNNPTENLPEPPTLSLPPHSSTSFTPSSSKFQHKTAQSQPASESRILPSILQMQNLLAQVPSSVSPSLLPSPTQLGDARALCLLLLSISIGTLGLGGCSVSSFFSHIGSMLNGIKNTTGGSATRSSILSPLSVWLDIQSALLRDTRIDDVETLFKAEAELFHLVSLPKTTTTTSDLNPNDSSARADGFSSKANFPYAYVPTQSPNAQNGNLNGLPHAAAAGDGGADHAPTSQSRLARRLLLGSLLSCLHAWRFNNHVAAILEICDDLLVDALPPSSGSSQHEITDASTGWASMLDLSWFTPLMEVLLLSLVVRLPSVTSSLSVAQQVETQLTAEWKRKQKLHVHAAPAVASHFQQQNASLNGVLTSRHESSVPAPSVSSPASREPPTSPFYHAGSGVGGLLTPASHLRAPSCESTSLVGLFRPYSTLRGFPHQQTGDGQVMGRRRASLSGSQLINGFHGDFLIKLSSLSSPTLKKHFELHASPTGVSVPVTSAANPAEFMQQHAHGIQESNKVNEVSLSVHHPPVHSGLLSSRTAVTSTTQTVLQRLDSSDSIYSELKREIKLAANSQDCSSGNPTSNLSSARRSQKLFAGEDTKLNQESPRPTSTTSPFESDVVPKMRFLSSIECPFLASPSGGTSKPSFLSEEDEGKLEQNMDENIEVPQDIALEFLKQGEGEMLRVLISTLWSDPYSPIKKSHQIKPTDSLDDTATADNTETENEQVSHQEIVSLISTLGRALEFFKGCTNLNPLLTPTLLYFEAQCLSIQGERLRAVQLFIQALETADLHGQDLLIVKILMRLGMELRNIEGLDLAEHLAKQIGALSFEREIFGLKSICRVVKGIEQGMMNKLIVSGAWKPYIFGHHHHSLSSFSSIEKKFCRFTVKVKNVVLVFQIREIELRILRWQPPYGIGGIGEGAILFNSFNEA